MNPAREAVQLRRPVGVELIPSGARIELPAGTPAQITQALGGSFTLLAEGRLVRLRGADADAIGKPLPAAPAPAAADPGAPLSQTEARHLVWRTLKTCYDPEIPIDIVELGLVYVCDVQPMPSGRMRVAIQMTLTAPGCGMGESLAHEVADKVLALPCVDEVRVDIVFDPPWDRSMMSEAALLSLGL